MFLKIVGRKNLNSKRKSKFDLKGFTLVEVLLAVSILAFCLTGLLLTYINLLSFTDLSRGFSIANNALRLKTEEIKNTAFANLSALDGTSFSIDGFNSTTAKGLIQVSNTSYSDLMKVRVLITFKVRNKTIGEDKDFDGILDTGEDMSIYTNGTNRLDSPVESVTLVTNYTN